MLQYVPYHSQTFVLILSSHIPTDKENGRVVQKPFASLFTQQGSSLRTFTSSSKTGRSKSSIYYAFISVQTGCPSGYNVFQERLRACIFAGIQS